MGGCCCCLSKRVQLNEQPVYYYIHQNLDEHGSLSSDRTIDSSLSMGLLADSNLDTYQPPPAPLPYDVDLGHSQDLPGILNNSSNKIGTVEGAGSLLGAELSSDKGLKDSVMCDKLEFLDCNNQPDGRQGSKVDEPSKLCESIILSTHEEDVCPTCLEEYDANNPRIMTKCSHHFHLSCILEWKERSETCPLCYQVMIFDHA